MPWKGFINQNIYYYILECLSSLHVSYYSKCDYIDAFYRYVPYINVDTILTALYQQ